MDIAAALQKLSADLDFHQKEDVKKELSAYLNYLLLNDFSALIQILYQVDVSEEKLKLVLKENAQADAGDLLAGLIIERQLQKRHNTYKKTSIEDIPDEECW